MHLAPASNVELHLRYGKASTCNNEKEGRVFFMSHNNKVTTDAAKMLSY